MRNELDQAPQPEQAHCHEQETRHDARDEEPGDPEADDDGSEDHDEGGGRSRYLEPRPSQERNDDAGDDRRVEPMMWRHSDRELQIYGERHRDDDDHHPRERVGPEILAAVSLAQL